MRGLLFDYILASSDLAWPGSRPVSGSESGAGMTLTSFALSDPSGGVRVFGLHTYIVVVVDPAVVVIVAVVVLSTPLLLLSWLCCCCYCCCCIIGIAQCVLSLNHANFIIIIFNDLSGISRQQKQKQQAAEQAASRKLNQNKIRKPPELTSPLTGLQCISLALSGGQVDLQGPVPSRS